MTDTNNEADFIAPLPNPALFAEALKRAAVETYLDNHPNVTRAARRAMRHNLRGVYAYIAEMTTPTRWRTHYAGNTETQGRLGVVVCAMAHDIATGTPMTDPDSAYQVTMREFFSEETANV
jgi:hypothetical protein